MSRILVTGATGLIGSAILKRLISAGHTVVGLSRRLMPNTAQVRWVQADLGGDLPSVLSRIEPVDAVIHNGATLVLGKTSTELEELQRVNCQASETLFRWSMSCGIRRFLFSSSISVVSKPLPEIITEQSVVGVQLGYSQSKLDTERMLLSDAMGDSLMPFIFRISSPVSLDPGALPRTVLRLWIERAKRGEVLRVFGTGSRTQDFVSVEDIASVYERALFSDHPGVYNIASGTTLSMRGLADMIGQKFGVGVELTGDDPNEDDRWTISIKKAVELLDYNPLWTASALVTKLLGRKIP